MPVAIKICGINEPRGLIAAARGGARYAGFVFYPPSPRVVSLAQAQELARQTPPGMQRTGLFVDPDNQTLEQILRQVPLDLLQLHGHETPRRVAEIAALTNLPVMKAIHIAAAEDFAAIDVYAPLVRQFLFDARPPSQAALPGGNAHAFDWRLLAGRSFPRPWILAGGLTPDNVAEAVRISGAAMVDVSSGVEDSPGVKNPDKIAAFCAAVAGL